MIDKMYVMFKSFFNYKSENTSKLVQALNQVFDILVKKQKESPEMFDGIKDLSNKKVRRQYVDAVLTFAQEPGSETPISAKNDKVFKLLTGWYNRNISQFRIASRKERDAYRTIRQMNVRNNEIFDMQWAVLTHRDTMSKMFNPGSFDTQKSTARKVQLLKAGHTWDEIQNLSLKELDKLLESSSNLNICLSSTQVYFHKQNMTAAKLIGIFANNNTSHAFLQSQDIFMNTKQAFQFNGLMVDSKTNNKIDNIKAHNGELISRNIAGFLEASVDAVKDPILNFLNINTATAGVAMTLIRLGFDVDSVGLFTSQPILEELTREYFRRSNEGYVSMDEIIRNKLAELTKKLNLDKIDPSIISRTEFTTEELAKELGNPTPEYQARVLLLFQNLFANSQNLQTLTFLTKFNSVSNAVGPSIADTFMMLSRKEKFENLLKGANPPFSINALKVIDNDPILKAFYDHTVSKNGAAQKIFQAYFPHYMSIIMDDVLPALNNSIRGNLDAKTINKAINDFMLYMLTAGNNPVIDGSREARLAYLLFFPRKMAEYKQMYSDNELMNAISITPRTNNFPIESLTLNSGSFGVDMQDRVRAAWTTLGLNSDRKIATDLFMYNLYRSGFNFSPKTFGHLTPVDIKMVIPGYIQALTDFASNNGANIDVNDFLDQLRRNNSYDTKFVPKLVEPRKINDKENFRAEERKNEITGDNTLVITFDEYKSGVWGIISEDDGINTTFSPMIRYKDKLYRLDESAVLGNRTIRYVETTPLGNKNNALEYDANTTSQDMTSIFNGQSITMKEAENAEGMLNKEGKEEFTPEERDQQMEDRIKKVWNELLEDGEIATGLINTLQKDGKEAFAKKAVALLQKTKSLTLTEKAWEKIKEQIKNSCG